MNPKIKKAPVYSVLFMRDDSGVTRFRVKAVWLKLMLLLFVLMTIAAAAGGYAAHYYWQRYEYHKAEARQLQAERTEDRRKLERLANLENILKSNDPELLRTLVSNVPMPEENGAAPAEAVSTANGSSGGESAALRDSRTRTHIENGQASRPPGESPEPGSAAARTLDPGENRPGQNLGQNVGQNLGQNVDQNAGQNVGQNAAAPAAPGTAKPHPVKLSNIQLRTAGERIQVSFDLANQDSTQPLSGRVSLALVEGGGKITPVENADSESGLRFYQIMRYKPITAIIPLPSGVAMASVAAVRVSVETEGNPPFAQRLPLPAE